MPAQLMPGDRVGAAAAFEHDLVSAVHHASCRRTRAVPSTVTPMIELRRPRAAMRIAPLGAKRAVWGRRRVLADGCDVRFVAASVSGWRCAGMRRVRGPG